jgi:hypothetical protein
MSNSNKPAARKPENAYAAFAALKVTKKDKYSWIAIAVAIAVLLACWWARSSQ